MIQHYTVHCTLYTVHCTLYTVQCTVHTVHQARHTTQSPEDEDFLTADRMAAWIKDNQVTSAPSPLPDSP